MRHNQISLIQTGAFSQDKFALIDVAFNMLTYFNFDAFGRRSLVGGVNISHNSIEKINGNNGRKLLIKFLDASHNKLTYDGVKIRNVCPRELLDLSFNRIERVDGDLFPSNCSIKVSSFIWYFLIYFAIQKIGRILRNYFYTQAHEKLYKFYINYVDYFR